MRLAALALVATLAGAGSGWAEDVRGIHIVSAKPTAFSSGQPLTAIITIENASDVTVDVSMTCAALRANDAVDVMPAAVMRLEGHQRGYASTLFYNITSGVDTVHCSINDVTQSR